MIVTPGRAGRHSDAALIAAGLWLRDFHAASRTFTPPPNAEWFGDHNDVRPGELIGHHDAAPYNAVWRPTPTQTDPSGGELMGFIDWDLAGPMEPVRDLAFVALTWVPLTARDIAVGDGFPPDIDRAGRLRMLLDAYGWTGTVAQVLEAVKQRARGHARGLRDAAEDGYGPAVALVAEGVADDFDRAADELDAATDQLLRATPKRVSD